MNRRLLPLLLLAALLVGCGDDAGQGPDGRPALRQLSDRDVTAFLAVSMDLLEGRGAEPVSGRFSGLDELLLHLERNPEGLATLCGEQEISRDDYLAIGHALQVCRSIEVGRYVDQLHRQSLMTPRPTPPDAGSARSGVPAAPQPPTPVEIPAMAPDEERLPPVALANLDLYRARRTEIERLLHLFHFVATQ